MFVLLQDWAPGFDFKYRHLTKKQDTCTVRKREVFRAQKEEGSLISWAEPWENSLHSQIFFVDSPAFKRCRFSLKHLSKLGALIRSLPVAESFREAYEVAFPQSGHFKNPFFMQSHVFSLECWEHNSLSKLYLPVNVSHWTNPWCQSMG